MKKVLAILLAACLALSLAACGGSRFFRACFHSAGHLRFRAGFPTPAAADSSIAVFYYTYSDTIYFHGPHRVWTRSWINWALITRTMIPTLQQNTQTEQVDTAITKALPA